MKPDHPGPGAFSRRDFLARATITAATLALGWRASAAPAPARWPIIAFSKPFQKLDAAATAELVSAVGWDGIECPVRARGQVEPERAPDELPRFAGVLRSHGKDVHIAATDITSMAQKHSETVLRAAAAAGVRRIRLGVWKYDLRRRPEEQLREIAPALKDIADACRDLGLQAGFQNHSGRDYVGAPVWDVFSLIRDLDPKCLGMCFDIGHATIEGGLSWPIEAKLMAPFYTAVFVKDFVWKKTAQGWKETWCPLGEGMVNPAFFAELKNTAYAGPVCQHHEYDLGNETEMIAHLRRDLGVLRGWLA